LPKHVRNDGAAPPAIAATPAIDRRALAAIGLVALALRLAFVEACRRAELLQGLFLDGAFYARAAASIRAGEGAGPHPYLLSPLYPYFLALFPGWDGDPVRIAALGPRVAQAFLGAGTAACAALAAARAMLAGGAPADARRRAGWTAGLGAATHGVLVHYDAGLLAEGPQAFLLVAALALALGPRSRRGELRAWLGVGALLGLAAALRPTALTAAAGLAAVVLLERRRRAPELPAVRAPLLGLALGLALAVGPFTVRNLVVGGEAVLLSANGGFNFWVGNHAGARGVFEAPPGYAFDADPLDVAAARADLGRDASYAEASAWWRARALADVRADPLGWLLLLGRKALFVLHPREIPQLGWGFDWVRARAGDRGIPWPAHWLLVLALLAPLAARVRPALASPYAVRVAWVVLVSQAAAIALFFVTGRFRAPLLPLAWVLAGLAADGLWRGLARAPRSPLAAVVAGVWVVACAAGHALASGPLRVPTETGIEESQRGIALLAAGRYAEAEGMLARSLELADTRATRAAQAEALRGLGRPEEAERAYRGLLAAHPDEELAWFNLGNVLWEDLRRGDEAEDAFRRAVRLRPEHGAAWFNLGAVLLSRRRFPEAAEAFRRATSLASDADPWRAEAERGLEVAERESR